MDFKATTPHTICDPDMLRAELKKVRDRGVAFDFQELSMELNCVAAPVFDAQGRVCSAISVSGPANRFTKERLEKVVPQLQETVEAITDALST